MADESLGTVLGALEETGAYDDTIVIFTSDHGDMCGSHGLRSKGPFVYEEIMHVPCYVQGARASRTPGSQIGRARHARRPRVDDLRARRRRSGDAAVAEGRRPLAGARATRRTSVRDHVLFAHDTAHTDRTSTTRATRSAGSSTGRRSTRATTASAAASRRAGSWGKDPGRKLYDVDAAFEDQEHEWYDLGEDPHEMVNLAHDRGRRAELRANYDRLLEYEARRVRLSA